MPSISIIIPAKNEEHGLRQLLTHIRHILPNEEILVIDDCSSDATSVVCAEFSVVTVKHPYSMGNGAAVKTGARTATGKILIFLDADGQHDPKDIPRLLAKLEEGYDMVVGARDSRSHATVGRRLANALYNWLASWMVGHKISDLTSGFRAVRAEKFHEFLYLLPNGFSYPTTITMSFFRAGYPVGYEAIHASPRIGRSHINQFRDGARFFLIIFKVGTLYSPLKLFIPFSLTFFLLGLGYYAYTFATSSRFTNMSALLLSISVIIFLIGLVSEQITGLLYSQREKR